MSRKWPPQIRFYIYPNEEKIFKKLKKIAEREGRTVTGILKDLVKLYVQKKWQHPNPQATLDKIMELGSARGPICSRCGSPATRIYFTESGRFFVCETHSRGLRKGGLIKGWGKL